MYKYTKIKGKSPHLQHITVFTTSLLLFITSAVLLYPNMFMFQSN